MPKYTTRNNFCRSNQAREPLKTVFQTHYEHVQKKSVLIHSWSTVLLLFTYKTPQCLSVKGGLELRMLKRVNYMIRENTISFEIHTANTAEHRQNLCWYVLGVQKVYSHFNLVLLSSTLSLLALQLDGIQNALHT